jgi:hypothetical protein
MCCIGYSPLYVFLLFSCDPGLRLTIRLRLRVIQISTFQSLSFFSVLNGWIGCSLFVSFAFSCAFLLLFFFISHAIVCSRMLHILSKHVSAQKMHLCIETRARANEHL